MVRFAWTFALVLGACGTEPACDASTLEAQLAAAGDGAVVLVGDCSIEGSFVVGEGVTLEGSGASSEIVAPGGTGAGPPDGPGEVALDVRGGTVRRLRVVAHGNAGIRTSGDTVVLEDLTVRVPHAGFGVGAEAVASLALTRVRVEGNIDSEERARLVPLDSAAIEFATHGLAFFDVGDAALREVEIVNFARFGALFVRSSTTWQNGSIEGGTNTGAGVYEGSAVLSDLTITEMWPSADPRPSYGMVVVAADVTTERLEISAIRGVGIMDGEARTEHVDVSIHDNTDIGIWSQSAEELVVRGAASEIRDNRYAGLALIEVHNATLEDATISGSTLGESGVRTGFGAVLTGEGIHMLGGAIDRAVVMRSLVVEGNVQSQILIDFEGIGANANLTTLEDVTVNGEDAALGLVVQGATVAETFDADVTRLGATELNDAMLTSELETLSLATSDQIPLPEDNLRGVVMPID